MFWLPLRCFFIPTTALAACTLIMLLADTEVVPLQHSGDIDLVSAAERGCSRSGERARRNSGELGSALFGLANDVFLVPATLVVVDDAELALPAVQCPPLLLNELFRLALLGITQPGLYDWVVFEAPG